MIVTGDKVQIFIVIYNLLQVLVPLLDLVEKIAGEALGETFE
jgi:hypothetical protein